MLQIQPHLLSLSPSLSISLYAPPPPSRTRPSPASFSSHLISSPLTPPQSHRLSVFLQFRNEPVTLLDHVCVLLVLVVGPVRLDDFVDAVDGAGDAVCGDEFGEVAGSGGD